MFIIIDIYSKNYSTLQFFLKNLLNKKVCNKLKLIVLESILQKKKKKKIFYFIKISTCKQNCSRAI